MKRQKIIYHDVPRETYGKIEQLCQNHNKAIGLYLDQLLWWNQRTNLVSRAVSRETLLKHVHHSLLLTELSTFHSSNVIVDAGTGGGLPGIPLAIVSPTKKFILDDINQKKIFAVKQIARKLALQDLSTLNASIENINMEKPFLLVSKHAFRIDELYQMVFSFPWEHLVFYKGPGFKDELKQIEIPLQIDVYRLDKNNDSDFYKDKIILVISR